MFEGNPGDTLLTMTPPSSPRSAESESCRSGSIAADDETSAEEELASEVYADSPLKVGQAGQLSGGEEQDENSEHGQQEESPEEWLEFEEAAAQILPATLAVELNCTICLERVSNPHSLSCHHTFCYTCINACMCVLTCRHLP